LENVLSGNFVWHRVGTMKNARLASGVLFLPQLLLLLLALGVSLIALVAGTLGVLLGAGGMLFAFCMVVLAMMFGRSAVRLGSIFVMFGCLIVGISSHWSSPVKIIRSVCANSSHRD
jgi:hypothetical protein